MTKYKQYIIMTLMAVMVTTGVPFAGMGRANAADVHTMPTLSERMKALNVEHQETNRAMVKVVEESIKNEDNLIKYQGVEHKLYYLNNSNNNSTSHIKKQVVTSDMKKDSQKVKKEKPKKLTKKEMKQQYKELQQRKKDKSLTKEERKAIDKQAKALKKQMNKKNKDSKAERYVKNKAKKGVKNVAKTAIKAALLPGLF